MVKEILFPSPSNEIWKLGDGNRRMGIDLSAIRQNTQPSHYFPWEYKTDQV